MELCELDNFDYYFKRIKKFTFLRFLDRKGYDITKLYNYKETDPSKQESEITKLDSMSVDDMIDIIENELITNSRIRFSLNDDSHGQLAGVHMRDLKEALKAEPDIGLPLQSPTLTTVARGARTKKLYLRSASSGAGKTRLGMADLCGISVPWYYDLGEKKWTHTGRSEPCLFISTELQNDELQTLVIAYVSGVNEEHILDGIYDKGEEERVDQAIEYIESSPLYFEFIPDFGIQDIINLIKKYKREKGCYYFCFDYIHMSSRLITDVANMSRAMRFREDQLLFLFVDTLKNLCNQLGVFILSMTQLNGTYKDSSIKDETMLRGAKNMADRIDLGEISLPPSGGDLENVKHILATRVNEPTPNLIRHIYKVRRGKLSRIKIWQYADLGTCRTTDLFVTNNDYKLIPVTATRVERDDAQIDKIIEEHSVPFDSIQEPDDDTPTPLFDW